MLLKVLFNNIFKLFSILRWTFLRIFFKSFIEITEIIKSTFVTYLINTQWFLCQQFHRVNDAIFIHELCKRFIGNFKYLQKEGSVILARFATSSVKFALLNLFFT